MAEIKRTVLLAPAGSTGNGTFPTVDPYAAIGEVGRNCFGVAFQFVVEAIGATPTVTFKYQGSMDGTNWYDVLSNGPGSDTPSAATQTATSVSALINWLDNGGARQGRFYRFYRCVVTANTNVTFRAEMYPVQD